MTGPGDIYQANHKRLGAVWHWAQGHGIGRWRLVKKWARKRLKHATDADKDRWRKERDAARHQQQKAAKRAAQHHHGGGPRRMADSVTVANLPDGYGAYAGYVGGTWPTWDALKARFSKLHDAGHLLSIAVNASEHAHCLDVEPGDALPSQVPAWIHAMHGRGVKRPCIYGSLSSLAEVLAELAKAGVKRSEYRVWSANPTGVEHIDGPGAYPGFNTHADATQWHWRGDIDESALSSGFFD